MPLLQLLPGHSSVCILPYCWFSQPTYSGCCWAQACDVCLTHTSCIILLQLAKALGAWSIRVPFRNHKRMRVCLIVYRRISSSLFLLLFFEPLSIAFETLQAILVHGFQLLDIYIHDSENDISNSRISKLFDISAAGSFGEWKGILIRNMGFLLDMITLLMALAHYVHIWWLHGMAFHLVDAVLFLNIRALLSAIVKRLKGFIKLRIALGTLHGALPDATLEELQTYDDECAICREPMAKAKKLSCNHLFHFACLRSWLDQGLTGNYSCPTCRKPLFIVNENEVNPQTTDVRGDALLAR